MFCRWSLVVLLLPVVAPARRLYWIATNEGFASRFVQAVWLWRIARYTGRELVVIEAPIFTEHLPEFVSWSLCDVFEFEAEDFRCGSRSATAVAREFDCRALGRFDWYEESWNRTVLALGGPVLMRNRYPLRTYENLEQLDCVAGPLFSARETQWFRKFDRDAVPPLDGFPAVYTLTPPYERLRRAVLAEVARRGALRLSYGDSVVETTMKTTTQNMNEAPLGVVDAASGRGLSVMRWRRGDQLKKRCHPWDGGPLDTSVNCAENVDEFVAAVRRVTADLGLPPSNAVFVATNEQDPDILRALRDAGFLLYDDIRDVVVANTVEEPTSLDTWMADMVLMCDAQYYAAWGVSESHQLIRWCRNHRAGATPPPEEEEKKIAEEQTPLEQQNRGTFIFEPPDE